MTVPGRQRIWGGGREGHHTQLRSATHAPHVSRAASWHDMLTAAPSNPLQWI